MKSKISLSFFLILLISSGFGLSPTRAETPASAAVDWSGILGGAAYHIRVPENWNGTLLVYAHGYTFVQPDPPDAAFGGEVFEDILLAQGYALAGSAYQYLGWAVKEGIHDTLVLTNFFREQAGEPDKIILYGMSMGGTITAKSIEKFPGIYDGGIPMCGPLAGTGFVDNILDVGLAYDVAIGWPAAWGTVEDPKIADVWTEILPVIFDRIWYPDYYGRHEFVRLVTNKPAEDFYLTPDQGYGFWVANILISYARAELELRAGGNPAQNAGRVYSLDDAEKAYLAGLGVDADSLLAAMNARANITADRNARNYLEHYADFTGRITRPVLTLHNKYDSVTPVEMESAYREKVVSAGYADNLIQVYTDGLGHCTFTPQQLLAVVAGMESWLETGVAPEKVSFPENIGFDNGFEPLPWWIP